MRRPLALIGVLFAISLYQRLAFQAAMRLALTDPLTGLANHRSFLERVQRELLRAEPQNIGFSLCLIDIDDFKRVNDLFGHPVGDHVLAQVGTRLRHDGEVFRLGGDEFAVLLPTGSAEEAWPVAQSILSRIGVLDLGEVGSVTASAGIASFPAHASELDELIRHADSALYWAKKHGKNRVAIFTREPSYPASATTQPPASPTAGCSRAYGAGGARAW
jgi:diguanylate cyclase (GGDEF)-like protein